MKANHKTDVVIIGAGPVGLFAIFECGMMGLSCHVVDALDMIGGQCAALYPEKPIYDIPAHPKLTGAELIENLRQQAAPFSPHYHLNQKVESLTRLENDQRWLVETEKGLTIDAKAIIIAAGVGAFGPNRPPLEGIELFEGKSVFYYIKSRQDFANKRIVIAGGGDSAVDWALSLAELAEHIYFVHRRPKFRAATESVNQLQALANQGKIEFVIPYQLAAIHGIEGCLSSVVVTDLEGKSRELKANILLPFFGLAMNLGSIANWGLDMDKKHIIVEPSTAATNISGIYAIGDVATYKGKQKLILTGFSEAAQAAHSIRELTHPGEVFHFEYSTTQGIPEIKQYN